MGGMTAFTSPPDHRLVGLNIFTRLEHILMAGQAEGAVSVWLLEKICGLRVVQLMTTNTVAVGKGTVQAEPSPFIGRPFMAAKAEGRLGGDK